MKNTSLLYLLCVWMLLSACTQSGRRQPNSLREITNVKNSIKSTKKLYNKNVVKMDKSGGVYQIPSIINGSSMKFIFDTGASDITISLTEALFLLKQGTLSEEDILGSQHYRIADGSISEGTVINLKTVEIGNRTLTDVKATVIHNMEAPLLLGQSALAQFGKVTIDYNKREITFE